jgi:hypothetical protein
MLKGRGEGLYLQETFNERSKSRRVLELGTIYTSLRACRFAARSASPG